MVRYGPWTTPPEQVDARIDRDGTFIETRPYNLLNLSITESSQQVQRYDEAFQVAFSGGEPTDAEALEVLVALGSGHTSTHAAFDHGSAAFLERQLNVPGASAVNRAAYHLGGYLRFVPTPVNYSPPGWDTAPHVVGIEFRGDNVVLDRWIALCAWFDDQSGNSYDGTWETTPPISDDPIFLKIDWMRLREADEYNYTSGFAPTIGDSGSIGAALALGADTPTWAANALGSDYANPVASTAAMPLVQIVDLDPTWIDTHGNVGVSAQPSVLRVGWDFTWPWATGVTDRRKSWNGLFRHWPGIRYQPADYRLVYDQAAPLRQYPRDDGLVGTSVARQASTATSRQASVRQSGYL